MAVKQKSSLGEIFADLANNNGIVTQRVDQKERKKRLARFDRLSEQISKAAQGTITMSVAEEIRQMRDAR